MRQDQVDTTTMSVLDVRVKPGRQQIRGALRYDWKELLAADALSLPLDHKRPIAVYGDNDEAVEAVVQKLRSNGFEGAEPLEGGLQEWIDNGLPTEDVTQEQPIPEVPAAGITDI